MLLDVPKRAPRKGKLGIDRYTTVRCGRLCGVRPRLFATVCLANRFAVLETVWKTRRKPEKEVKRMW